MSVKITTLIENNVESQGVLQTEHGLSIMIETVNGTVLMDTGASEKILENAKFLKVPIEKTDHIVLSHGHYDHTGGLEALLGVLTKRPQIWISEFFFKEKFKRNDDGMDYIGAPFGLKQAEAFNAQLNRIPYGVKEIMKDVYLFSGFKRNDPFEVNQPQFVLKQGTEAIVDSFEDEISIVVRTARGLVIVFGCGHPGPVNMLTAICDHFNEPIHLLLGGTHLIDASEGRIRHTIDVINSLQIERVGVSHCTGEKASEMLYQALGDSFFNNWTGNRLIIE